MSDDSYPLLSVSHLARRVQNSEVSEIRRDWTGNDESSRNHHDKVDLSESPLRVGLSWKRSPKVLLILSVSMNLILGGCLQPVMSVSSQRHKTKSGYVFITGMTT